MPVARAKLADRHAHRYHYTTSCWRSGTNAASH